MKNFHIAVILSVLFSFIISDSYGQEDTNEQIISKINELEIELEKMSIDLEHINTELSKTNLSNNQEFSNLKELVEKTSRNQEILSQEIKDLKNKTDSFFIDISEKQIGLNNNFNEIKNQVGNLTETINQHDGSSWGSAFLAILIGTVLGLGSWALGLAGIIPTRKRQKGEESEKQARIDHMKAQIPKLAGYVDWFFSEKKNTVLRYNAEPNNRTQLKSQLDGWDTSIKKVVGDLQSFRNSNLLGLAIEEKIKTFCNHATKISILENNGTLTIPDDQKVINARKELEKAL